MWALQEARFYVIIWVIMLIGILGYFFTLQNTVGYTDYSTSLKTTYADVKAKARLTKTLQDVLTLNGTDVRVMSNNQLFGLTLETTADNIDVFDNYTVWNDIDVVKAASGKFKIVYLTTNSDGWNQGWTTDLKNNVSTVTATGTSGTKLSDLSALNTNSPTFLQRGWTMDSDGYIAYVFESEAKATDIMNNYLAEGTLVGVSDGSTTSSVSAAVVVPFNAN